MYPLEPICSEASGSISLALSVGEAPSSNGELRDCEGMSSEDQGTQHESLHSLVLGALELERVRASLA
jgi:hypothetical protein